MKLTDRLPTRRVTVLAQDPSVLDADGAPLFTEIAVPNDRVAPGPQGARFHVIDYDAALERLIPPNSSPDIDLAAGIAAEPPARRLRRAKKLLADPHFHAQNVFAIAAATLREFETALGRHVNWGFESGAHQLKIAPHAFTDLNAFYSREDEALVFGYYPKTDVSDDYIFTCLSHDIVVHETTHAILDGLRTEYIRPASVDQAAFHEAFADIVAILSVFRNEGIIRVGLGAQDTRTIKAEVFAPSRLRKSFLFGLAKEFGETLSRRGFGLLHGDALRRSVEIEPDPEAYAGAFAADEEHAFGEILVAAVLNTFIHIWCRRVAPLDPVSAGRLDQARAVEEGAKAAQHLLGMCIRALDYLPPANVTFGDYARAILTADLETAPDDGQYGYRQALCDGFAAYGIVPAGSTPSDLRWRPPSTPEALVYGFDGHAEMQWDRESVFRFLWENLEVLGLSPEGFTRIISVRPVVRHGPNGAIVRETVVEYMQQINVLSSMLVRYGLKRPQGMNTRTFIQLVGGGTLIFDDYGSLKYAISNSVLGKDQQKRIDSLWESGHFDNGHRAARRFADLHVRRSTGRGPVARGESW
jgi:hypothetical protein